MPLFDLIQLPFCSVLLTESWNASPHRYFLAYRAQGSFRNVMGLSVVDEFATFSSPIFFAPVSLLGKIYNAGLTLGHLRGPDMDIDMGWPPVCVGTDDTEPNLPEDWEKQLLRALQSPPSSSGIEARQVGDFHIQSIQIGQTDVYATDAPLLPKQLRRICQMSKLPLSIAFSTGNRITRVENAATLSVQVVSEKILSQLTDAFQ